MQKIVMEWKSVVGYEGVYDVSSTGLIRNKNGQVLKTRLDKDGYERVTLHGLNGTKKVIETFLVHRLVAKSFLDNPNNYKYVRRKNSDKSDNSIYNLEWSKERIYTQPRTSIKKNKEILNLDTQQKFKNIAQAAKLLGIGYGTIYNCCNGRNNTAGGFRWAYL